MGIFVTSPPFIVETEKMIKTLSCNVNVAAGNWVVMKNGILERAQSDNLGNLPAIGIVISKPTNNTATVVTEGWIDLSGLSGGKEYYISASVPGGMQDNAGSVNIVQKVGTAYTDTKFYVDVDSTLIEL